MSDIADKPVYILMHELREKILVLSQNKYNLIIEFVNESCDLNLKSLTCFKKINLNKINMDLFEDTLNKYKYKLEGEFEIDIDDIHIDIKKILSDCLNSIDYMIVSHAETTTENTLLTILDKPRKNKQ